MTALAPDSEARAGTARSEIIDGLKIDAMPARFALALDEEMPSADDANA